MVVISSYNSIPDDSDFIVQYFFENTGSVIKTEMKML